MDIFGYALSHMVAFLVHNSFKFHIFFFSLPLDDSLLKLKRTQYVIRGIYGDEIEVFKLKISLNEKLGANSIFTHVCVR